MRTGQASAFPRPLSSCTESLAVAIRLTVGTPPAPTLNYFGTEQLSGLPGLEIVQYYRLVAPAGTPQPIVERLNKELRKIVASEDMKKRLLDAGGDPIASTPAEYGQNIRREESKWKAVIKKARVCGQLKISSAPTV